LERSLGAAIEVALGPCTTAVRGVAHTQPARHALTAARALRAADTLFSPPLFFTEGVCEMPATKKATRSAARKPAKKGAREATKRPAARRLSAAHKRALAEGRTMSATVDRYLAALNTPKRRGRKVSRAALQQRLTDARSRAKSATGVDKVLAAQQVRDLDARIASLDMAGGDDLKSLEAAFVKIAKRFGQNRGIGYGAWRDAGVPAVVLKKAGVARTRG
jgi:hypothetical protein